MNMAGHGYVAWRGAQPGDLREETDVDVEVMVTRFQQDGAASVSEMGPLLLTEPAGDRRLCVWRAGVDEQDIRPKVGIRIVHRKRRFDDNASTDGCHAGNYAAPCRLWHFALPFR
ncbi:hypothetical protein [Sphingomonas sp. CV7422]|uniref:hypothetical protein n=1 Tax=Sphingomonas sp. CV7422 TaxID=3018036 RepID=UPI0022FDF83B|nr:hypothetical protein [Sphingomonas sp. CV7422]